MMTSKKPSRDAEVLEKAVNCAKRLPEFSEDDIAVLRRVIDIVRGVDAFGRLAETGKRIAMYLGWLVAFYIAFKAGVIDFIKSAAVSR